MALLLVGVNGSLAGRKFDLSSELTVGREVGSSIVLANDSGVSRRHARFFWMQGLPMLEDLGSRNGTFLNAARISQARPISSGDEIRIGAEVFRVEAAMDQPASAPPQAPVGGQKEVSRGEGRSTRNRRPEQGSAEGTLYRQDPSAGYSSSNGCAMPNIDLSGCLRYLWIILLILLVAAVIGAIIFGLASLLSGVGSVGSTGASGASPQTPPPSQPPQYTPPPSSGGGGGAPPPPQQTQSQEGIIIQAVKVDFVKREGGKVVPIVLVKWVNGTKNPVKRLSGAVTLYGRDGNLLAEIPREAIYAGSPVGPGETHEDTLTQGGIIIRRELKDIPATAQVQIERVE